LPWKIAMFKRLIDFHLDKWKIDPYRKPLLLRGARQVGKTYAYRLEGCQKRLLDGLRHKILALLYMFYNRLLLPIDKILKSMLAKRR